MQDSAHSHRDLVMGALAGQAALAARTAARTLYDAGGRDVLPTVAQAGLQTVLTRTATGTVAAAAPTLLVDAAVQAGAAEVTSLAVVTTARAAGAQIARTAARAGVVGLVVDAAFGAAEGVMAYRRGTMTGKQACVHATVEAGTGAASTSVGVLVAAGAVALTGGLAAPTVMAIGTGTALAAKLGLRRLFVRNRASKPAAPLPAAS
jgi:hypothetical protein